MVAPALGQLLRQYRRAAGLTQEELADRAGISARTVSDAERGLRETIYRDTAMRVADALGLAGDERARFEAAARGRQSAPASLHSPAAGAPHSPLPMPPTPLVGREQELKGVLDRLRDPQVRLVTLIGAGGIGKTRLALAAAQAASADYPDGVWFVPLGETRDPTLVPALVAHALGVNPARQPVAELVTARLGGQRALLILDTFEHLLDAAPFVAALVTECPRLTVLTTSRAALRLRGEYEFTVPPLSVDTAIELFIERASAVRDQLQLATYETAPVVAEICRRLDGIPLAVELAAARVKHLPLSALRDHLEHRLGLLTGGPRDSPARHRAMRDTVAWSYDLLDDDAQAVFRQLSVLTDWTLTAAQHVCATDASTVDVLAALSTLVDQSLVLLSDDPADGARYRMLDVVRQYAAEQCQLQGEAATAADRHADYFLALAEQAEPQMRGSSQLAWHRRLRRELPNLRLAFEYLTRSRDGERALRLAAAMWMFWLWDGGFAEGRGWLTDALSLEDGTNVEARGKALWGIGWLAYHQGDYDDTARFGKLLLEVARHSTSPAHERNGLTLRGMSAMAEGRYDDAVELFRRGLEICRKLDDDWLIATSCLNFGTATMHAGDLETAEKLFTEARNRYRDLGDEPYTARARRHLATCRLLRADPVSAAELLDASLRSCLDADGAWGVAETLEGFALLAAVDGNARRAATFAAAAAALHERLGTRQHPFDAALGERLLAAVEQDADWSPGWQAGRAMPLDDVVDLAFGLSSGLERSPRTRVQ